MQRAKKRHPVAEHAETQRGQNPLPSDCRETHVFSKRWVSLCFIGAVFKGKKVWFNALRPPFQVEGDLLHVLYRSGHQRLFHHVV
ncbi:hypothetical protein GON22_18425 [Paenibacillus sp. MMS18-CY102]|nr:hypothetical protein [Paenibacillus sp. MMS18-CY102]